MAGATKPNEQPHYPTTMIRYDGPFQEGLAGTSSVWVCQDCCSCVLSQEAIVPHLKKCKKSPINYKLALTKKIEDTSYICALCDESFSRKVELKNHLKAHE